MKTITCHLSLFVLILAMPSRTSAQYWDERVLEKGFEQTSFFFVPSTINPYGLGGFASTTPGLLNDPLLDLSVSPAHLRLDSLNPVYVYADFRSARTIHDQGNTFVAPWISYVAADNAVRPYPWVYLNTRRELEPVFSGALIGRPLPETQPGFLVGGTYQLILQDDKYYSVPQDIYRSVIGEDYTGNRMAGASSIPIVDKYSGQDNIHERGHFISAFTKYEVPSIGSFGLKISRVMFDRSGGFGSSNFWGPQGPAGTSLWSNLESRSQSYAHWELTGGVDFAVTPKTTVGATAGWLWGNAAQALHRGDSSFYSWPSPYQSLYQSSGNTLEEWRHNGHNVLLGLDITSRLSDKHTLHLLYQRQRSTIDVGLGSGILDTSYSSYTYVNIDTPVTSTSYSVLQDQRSGFGEQSTTTDRFLASLQWQMDERMSLALGIQLDWLTTETHTTESVLAHMGSVYRSTQGAYDWISSSDQSKDLLWTFTARKTSFQIPIFLTIRASDAIDVLLGLNRAMTHSKVDDVTLALFRYRNSNNNGTMTDQSNFGERYTTPTEELSDIRTTFLAGLTATPSGHFRVRLLVVPNFQDTFNGSQLENLQWWIGVNIMP